MKYLFLTFLSIFFLGTSYAYTPSSSLVNYLDDKVLLFEDMIEQEGESVRSNIIVVLKKFQRQQSSEGSQTLQQNKRTFIISYLLEQIEQNGSKKRTRADFAASYQGFSIVEYPEQIVATVINTGPLGQTNDDSFENLAGFIFGDNRSNTEIAMTSPVTRTQIDTTTYETAFIMPERWTMITLPQPNNDRITIKTIPGSLKAVKRFSGRVSKDIVDQQRATFQSELREQGIIWYGLPTLSQYDGPWVRASQRRNELWVELNPPQ